MSVIQTGLMLAAVTVLALQGPSHSPTYAFCCIQPYGGLCRAIIIVAIIIIIIMIITVTILS